MESHTLRRILSDAVEIGATKALITTGAIKAHISRAQANKMYGRHNVDRWIGEGLLHTARDNRRIRIDRVHIEIISKTSNH